MKDRHIYKEEKVMLFIIELCFIVLSSTKNKTKLDVVDGFVFLFYIFL